MSFITSDPDPNPFIYLDIFKSVGFSVMDFFVAMLLTGTASIISSFVTFFALSTESQKLEKDFIEMAAIKAKPFCRIPYKGKGLVVMAVLCYTAVLISTAIASAGWFIATESNEILPQMPKAAVWCPCYKTFFLHH
jgi:hypothetical protein